MKKNWPYSGPSVDRRDCLNRVETNWPERCDISHEKEDTAFPLSHCVAWQLIWSCKLPGNAINRDDSYLFSKDEMVLRWTRCCFPEKVRKCLSHLQISWKNQETIYCATSAPVQTMKQMGRREKNMGKSSRRNSYTRCCELQTRGLSPCKWHSEAHNTAANIIKYSSDLHGITVCKQI